MSDLSSIRAALAAVLASVPGIGVVHDRERYGKQAAALAGLYVPEGQDKIAGWFIRRVGTRRQRPDLGGPVVTIEWRLTGYASFIDADASEHMFDALIEGIAAAFEADPSLGLPDVDTAIEDAAGIQVIDSGPITFCGHLCHSARLALFTRVYL
jgi:hypothetical protein